MKAMILPKEFKMSESACDVITSLNGVGSVTFTADVPKGVLVTGVFVNGKNIEDYAVDEWNNNSVRCDTRYPRGKEFDGKMVVAVYVDETCGGELYNLAFSGGIESLVVEYVDIFCDCGCHRG